MPRPAPLAVAVLLLLAVTGDLACARARGLSEVEGGIELALQRGSAWSTVKVRPPYVIGPQASLKLSRGLITGMSPGGGMVHIRVDRQGALGHGPGRIDVDFFDEGPDEFHITGVWNSAPVHFVISEGSFRGSIRGASGHCQYVLDRTLPDGARTGFSICSGLPEETRLEIPRAVVAWLTRPELAVVMMELFSEPPTTALEGRYSL